MRFSTIAGLTKGILFVAFIANCCFASDDSREWFPRLIISGAMGCNLSVLPRSETMEHFEGQYETKLSPLGAIPMHLQIDYCFNRYLSIFGEAGTSLYRGKGENQNSFSFGDSLQDEVYYRQMYIPFSLNVRLVPVRYIISPFVSAGVGVASGNLTWNGTVSQLFGTVFQTSVGSYLFFMNNFGIFAECKYRYILNNQDANQSEDAPAIPADKMSLGFLSLYGGLVLAF